MTATEEELTDEAMSLPIYAMCRDGFFRGVGKGHKYEADLPQPENGVAKCLIRSVAANVLMQYKDRAALETFVELHFKATGRIVTPEIVEAYVDYYEGSWTDFSGRVYAASDKTPTDGKKKRSRAHNSLPDHFVEAA